MKLIKPYCVIEDAVNGIELITKIEKAGRTCYKSEDKITENSAKEFVAMIIKNGHHSVLEHEKMSVRIICDRGVSHEIVRHRIASYSQESTRYCNYSKDKFDNNLTFIIPEWLALEEGFYKSVRDTCPKEFIKGQNIWVSAMLQAEICYLDLIKTGWKPQQARSILPNSLKTEIVCTFNLREWRHFFTLRTSPKAHPQMREIACPLLDEFKQLIPIIFDDIEYV